VGIGERTVTGDEADLRIRLPETITLPGRLMEVRLAYGVVRLICAVADAPRPQQTIIGVDLGVNTLVAATDGTTAMLVSGRGVKAIIRWRNNSLAIIRSTSYHVAGQCCRIAAPVGGAGAVWLFDVSGDRPRLGRYSLYRLAAQGVSARHWCR
jgi:hypothetical protein